MQPRRLVERIGPSASWAAWSRHMLAASDASKLRKWSHDVCGGTNTGYKPRSLRPSLLGGTHVHPSRTLPCPASLSYIMAASPAPSQTAAAAARRPAASPACPPREACKATVSGLQPLNRHTAAYSQSRPAEASFLQPVLPSCGCWATRQRCAPGGLGHGQRQALGGCGCAWALCAARLREPGGSRPQARVQLGQLLGQVVLHEGGLEQALLEGTQRPEQLARQQVLSRLVLGTPWRRGARTCWAWTARRAARWSAPAGAA